MAGLILLVLVVALGVASLLGVTADSRDPDYGLGPLVRRTIHADARRGDA